MYNLWVGQDGNKSARRPNRAIFLRLMFTLFTGGLIQAVTTKSDSFLQIVNSGNYEILSLHPPAPPREDGKTNLELG